MADLSPPLGRPLGVVGSLCSLDVLLADAFKRQGIPAVVLRPAGMAAQTEADLAAMSALSSEDVRTFSGALGFLRAVRGCSFVFSYGGHLGYHAGRPLAAWPLLRRLGWPAYMNIGTGSDMTEMVRTDSPQARVYRRTMRHAWTNMVLHYPEALRSVASLRLRNACVLPPIQAPISQSDPAPIGSASRFRRDPDELVILHPSNLDWAQEDSDPRRNSTKGNDRFLRALARAIAHHGLRARLVILDRGPDRVHARTLIGELGLEPYTVWLPGLSRDQLLETMGEADLVVDQFDVGILGMIAFEAMGAGRPVVIYAQPATQRLVYDEDPPVLAARTEGEILAQLLAAGDREWLRRKGDEARAWAMRHSSDRLVVRYLFYALAATGRAPIDVGWGSRDGSPLL